MIELAPAGTNRQTTGTTEGDGHEAFHENSHRFGGAARMLLTVEDHRRRARSRLPRFVFDFIDGAAEDERARCRNREALDAVTLLPSCLRDVSAVDTATELFGRRWAMPVAAAPTGLNALIHPEADIRLARSAAAAGLPFVLSTASNTRLEAVRAACPEGELWFQLYVVGERAIAEQMITRAKRAGYSALVLTVDVPVSGKRERDLRHRFRLPFRPSPATMLDLCRHPLWLARLLASGVPRFPNLSEHEPTGGSSELDARLLARAMDRSLAWDDVAWLRRQWDGPILLKGVLNPADAAVALEHGVDGLIVSNHGGRQLDAAPATITMLPQVVRAVAGRVPVLVDGGFRRGSDVVKALALGADGVLVGRPLLFGLAADGPRGVRRVLDTMADELATAMTLMGVPTVDVIRRDRPLGPHLRKSPPAHEEAPS